MGVVRQDLSRRKGDAAIAQAWERVSALPSDGRMHVTEERGVQAVEERFTHSSFVEALKASVGLLEPPVRLTPPPEDGTPRWAEVTEAGTLVAAAPPPIDADPAVVAALDQPFSCLLGTAGTGKTTFLRAWERSLEGGLVICATTGIAAVNVGGTTINSYLKYFDTRSLLEMYTAGYLTSKLRKFRRAGLRRLVIDEVSMLDGNQLTCLARAVQEVNGAEGFDLEEAAAEDEGLPPLGLTLCGDFCQLPPVKAPFAFESPEWPLFADTTHTLTKVWRQTDQAYVDALTAIRRGDARAALEVLRPCFSDHTDMSYGGPTLLAKNDAVERFNRMRLDELKVGVQRITSSRWGEQPSEWKQIPETLELKDGARVMVLANAYDADEDRYLYVNGDLGTFLGTDPDGKTRVAIERTGTTEVVGKVTREHKVLLEDETKEERAELRKRGLIKDKYKIIGEITYMPLRVAYATTVHKSQGLSLDAVQINLREGFMAAPGMVYVALSRCRSLEGLRLVGKPETLITRCAADKRVRRYQ